MSEKTSRLLLILEAIFIAFPFSAISTFVSFTYVLNMFKYQHFSVMALGIFALISLVAIGSGWWLFIIYLRKGISGLKSQHFSCWVVIFLGVLILIGSFVSRLLPPSPEYSRMWDFRLDFDLFISALPLLVPLGHLALERLFRKPVKKPFLTLKSLHLNS